MLGRGREEEGGGGGGGGGGEFLRNVLNLDLSVFIPRMYIKFNILSFRDVRDWAWPGMQEGRRENRQEEKRRGALVGEYTSTHPSADCPH